MRNPRFSDSDSSSARFSKAKRGAFTSAYVPLSSKLLNQKKNPQISDSERQETRPFVCAFSHTPAWSTVAFDMGQYISRRRFSGWWLVCMWVKLGGHPVVCIGYLEDISHLGVLKQYKKTIWPAAWEFADYRKLPLVYPGLTQIRKVFHEGL